MNPTHTCTRLCSTTVTRAREGLLDERGSAGLETAIVFPVVLMILALVIGIGRYANTASAIDDAAYGAARAASIARTPSAARADATSTATALLGQHGISCQSSQVSVDTSGFARPAGQPAQVRVDLACDISWADLTYIGGGTRHITTSAASAIDTYRSRTQ